MNGLSYGEWDFTVTDITAELKDYEQLSKNRHDGTKTRAHRGDAAVSFRVPVLGEEQTMLYFERAESASRNIASKGPSFLCLTTAANAFSATAR
jgi:hypothetical protein